jgi:hypothetical protein
VLGRACGSRNWRAGVRARVAAGGVGSKRTQPACSKLTSQACASARDTSAKPPNSLCAHREAVHERAGRCERSIITIADAEI